MRGDPAEVIQEAIYSSDGVIVLLLNCAEDTVNDQEDHKDHSYYIDQVHEEAASLTRFDYDRPHSTLAT